MDPIEGLIKKAKNIPSLPQVTTKLLEVFNDTTSQAKDVGKIIESDQSIAAQVLKQANSPFYGFPNRSFFNQRYGNWNKESGSGSYLRSL